MRYGGSFGWLGNEHWRGLPVAFTVALLLGALRIVAGMADFAEVAWEMLFSGSGAIGKTNVVTVSHFVGASH